MYPELPNPKFGHVPGFNPRIEHACMSLLGLYILIPGLSSTNPRIACANIGMRPKPIIPGL